MMHRLDRRAAQTRGSRIDEKQVPYAPARVALDRKAANEGEFYLSAALLVPKRRRLSFR
jgi:hypothetical protein